MGGHGSPCGNLTQRAEKGVTQGGNGDWHLRKLPRDFFAIPDRPQQTRRGVLGDRGSGRASGVSADLWAGLLDHESHECRGPSREFRLSSNDVALRHQSEASSEKHHVVFENWSPLRMVLDGGRHVGRRRCGGRPSDGVIAKGHLMYPSQAGCRGIVIWKYRAACPIWSGASLAAAQCQPP